MSGPKNIAIVALGPSSLCYIRHVEGHGGRSACYDEVWAVNSYGDVLACDRAFHMDDVRVQEVRAAAVPGGKIDNMLRWMRKHPGPIYTSRKHPDYPGTVDYPLEAVINAAGSDYFNNTVAYAIALAIAIGVEKMSLYGLDFDWKGASEVEPGRACCEYWIGRAQQRGIQVEIATGSTLMDTGGKPGPRYYGYDTLEVTTLINDEGKAVVTMTPHDNVPSATEIEQRYDHNPVKDQPDL